MREKNVSTLDKEYEQTFLKYKNLVFWVCNKRLNSPDDAEEASQDVFIRFYKNQERVTNPSSWLYSCARSVTKDRRNSALARRKREMEWDYLQICNRNHSDQNLKTTLRECVELLPTPQRELLKSYYFDRQKQQDLAVKYGVSQGTIHKRLSRILSILREHMQDKIQRTN